MNKREILRFMCVVLVASSGGLSGNGAEPPHTRRLERGLISVSTTLLAAQQPPAAGDGKILYYQDPMHPWYKSDKPGIAPDCGMKLVPVYAGDVPATKLPPGSVEISAARQQAMGVETAKAEYRSIDRSVRATGQVVVDETRQVSVHIRTT